jgi:DNA polymerase
MNHFDSALDLVLRQLHARRMGGATDWCATQRSLERLCSPRPAREMSGFAPGKAERLTALRASPERLPCALCPYGQGAHGHVVFGIGNIDAELMFVGEAPGAEEDVQGEPFVGRAGQLLNKMIVAMGYQREQIYLANVLKCRPDLPEQTSGNRPPTPAEMESCRPCLYEQIAIIQPKVIVALGATALRGLLDADEPIGRLRGRWHDFRGIPVMPTYHPSYLLRNQALSERRKVWEDLLAVKERLGHVITDRDRSYFVTKA